MLIIAHRGNINGPDIEHENTIPYLEHAINYGYDVEIDLWLFENKLFLGHDKPDHPVSFEWISYHQNNLWLHCKNVACMSFLIKSLQGLNFFNNLYDDFTITSQHFIWTFNGLHDFSPYSIIVLPEKFRYNADELSINYGICTDFCTLYSSMFAYE